MDTGKVGVYMFSIDAYVANGDGKYFTEKMGAMVQVVAGEPKDLKTTSFIEITEADEMIHRIHADYSMSEFEWQSK